MHQYHPREQRRPLEEVARTFLALLTIAAFVALVVAATVLLTADDAPRYSATTRLRLSDETEWPFHDSIRQDVAALARTAAVADQVRQDLDDPASLRAITARVSRNQAYFDVTAQADDPVSAEEAAALVVVVLQEANTDLQAEGLRRDLELVDLELSGANLSAEQRIALASRRDTLLLDIALIRPQFRVLEAFEVSSAQERARRRAIAAFAATLIGAFVTISFANARYGPVLSSSDLAGATRSTVIGDRDGGVGALVTLILQEARLHDGTLRVGFVPATRRSAVRQTSELVAAGLNRTEYQVEIGEPTGIAEGPHVRRIPSLQDDAAAIDGGKGISILVFPSDWSHARFAAVRGSLDTAVVVVHRSRTRRGQVTETVDRILAQKISVMAVCFEHPGEPEPVVRAGFAARPEGVNIT